MTAPELTAPQRAVFAAMCAMWPVGYNPPQAVGSYMVVWGCVEKVTSMMIGRHPDLLPPQHDPETFVEQRNAVAFPVAKLVCELHGIPWPVST